MSRVHLPCAFCEKFAIAGYERQAAAGQGRCTGFDMPGTPETFVAWDARPCVLFHPARNRVARERFAAQHTKEAP